MNRINLRYGILAFLILSLALSGWLILQNTTGSSYSPSSYSETREALGTVITITLYDTSDNPMSAEELNNISDELFSEVSRLELIFSSKLENSQLSLLNESAQNQSVAVSPELMNIFKLSLEYAGLSNGAFDISIGSLISLWNIGSEAPYLPSADELKPYIGLENWKKIQIDEENSTISYGGSGFTVDLGAIAKGYVGDRLKVLAEDMGISCGMLNLGGNIVTIGNRYNGEQWTIGITNPLSPDSVIAVLKLTDMSVVTSGNYERYFIRDGIRYHHILNPFTGYPAENGIISSTIIGYSSSDCDALSTACYVLGLEKSLSLIESLDGFDAVFVDNDGNIHTTSGIDNYNFTINQ